MRTVADTVAHVLGAGACEGSGRQDGDGPDAGRGAARHRASTVGGRAGVAPLQWSDNDAVPTPVTFGLAGRLLGSSGGGEPGVCESVRIVSQAIHKMDAQGGATAYG